MITVVIPALNEESTVAHVVEVAKQTIGVDEVIVVDDKSTDETVSEARRSGAKVVTSTKLGKGVSMKGRDCKIFCVNVFNGLFSEAAPGFENVQELL